MGDIQCYVVLWFFSEAFPHPPQKILQELQGQLPWVQAWYDRVHARPACVAAREYREKVMADQPTAQSNAADVPANVNKSDQTSSESKPTSQKESNSSPKDNPTSVAKASQALAAASKLEEKEGTQRTSSL